MKREGVCEDPPYESAFNRRCIVKQKNKSLDLEILAAIAERERQNRPPALDKASCKKWFTRAETIRQMGMTCTAYIDDELPTVIGTALGERGCNEPLNRDEINGVRQTVSRELQSEYDKTKNVRTFCATMLNYRREVYRMFYQPVPAPKYIERCLHVPLLVASGMKSGTIRLG